MSGSKKIDLFLDIEELLQFFQEDGPIATILDSYEKRDEQLEMIKKVVDTYNDSAISLIEAGTGTGKSLAYLLPAIMWALKFKERTLVSTHTITLQEQLINKDIPFIAKALGLNFKACLVKGMGNYLCLRKFKDIVNERKTFSQENQEVIDQIEEWSCDTPDGSSSDIPFKVHGSMWEQVNAEADACGNVRCPQYKDCFFFKARKETRDAQILVVNHHLLFADLASRQEDQFSNDSGILPNYDHIILDEAHSLEGVATESLAEHVSPRMLSRLLARLGTDKNRQQGKLQALKRKIQDYYSDHIPEEAEKIIMRIDLELIPGRRNVLDQLAQLFQEIDDFAMQFLEVKTDAKEGKQHRIKKIRMLEKHYQNKSWIQNVQPLVEGTIATLRNYQQLILGLEQSIKLFLDDKLDNKTGGIRLDIQTVGNRLEYICDTLKRFSFKETTEIEDVRWIEMEKNNPFSIDLKIAVLNINNLLVDILFQRFSSFVLCSATLTTNKSFNFIKKRLGITSDLLGDRKINSIILDSPFNYQEQVLMVVPNDLPLPNDPAFIPRSCEEVYQAILASRGNAFILFTSYGLLSLFYQNLKNRLVDKGFHLFKQGDAGRHLLLEKFREEEQSVLFGTDTFWEGVDVVGDALRLVIITKLPFQVPSEPVIQARCEKLIDEGKDPFFEYAVPNAIVKFKQGFGRLIRNKNDKGCIFCLDARLISKPYGKLFLRSLPPCRSSFLKVEELKEKMRAFFDSSQP